MGSIGNIYALCLMLTSHPCSMEVYVAGQCQESFAPCKGRRAFSMSPDQPLRGAPIREGQLWHLSTEAGSIRKRHENM